MLRVNKKEGKSYGNKRVRVTKRQYTSYVKGEYTSYEKVGYTSYEKGGYELRKVGYTSYKKGGYELQKRKRELTKKRLFRTAAESGGTKPILGIDITLHQQKRSTGLRCWPKLPIRVFIWPAVLAITADLSVPLACGVGHNVLLACGVAITADLGVPLAYSVGHNGRLECSAGLGCRP